jgi:hypothetical protein
MVAHGVINDLGFRGLVKNDVRVGGVTKRRMAGLSVRVPMWG